MLIAAGASASGLSATNLASEDGSTKQFLQRRQLLRGATSPGAEAVFHSFRLSNRKISQARPVPPPDSSCGPYYVERGTRRRRPNSLALRLLDEGVRLT